MSPPTGRPLPSLRERLPLQDRRRWPAIQSARQFVGETERRLDPRAHRGTAFTPSGNRPMTNDLKTWKRNTAVRRFHEIKAEADLNGIPMPDAAAAEQAALHYGATKDPVLRWVREGDRKSVV